jgi:hypothetical protein
MAKLILNIFGIEQEIVGEIQSYLDLVSLGKCRLINSEWSNIAAAKLKGRIHEFEEYVSTVTVTNFFCDPKRKTNLRKLLI